MTQPKDTLMKAFANRAARRAGELTLSIADHLLGCLRSQDDQGLASRALRADTEPSRLSQRLQAPYPHHPLGHPGAARSPGYGVRSCNQAVRAVGCFLGFV